MSMTKWKVFSIIQDRIIYMEYKPGEAINETALAEELGVSRTPVREALLLLANENLVDVHQHVGTFASKIDLVFIKEITFMRNILETEVLSALARTGGDLSSKIDEYLYLQERHVKHYDVKEFVKVDRAFHEELFRQAGHEIVWSALERQYMHTIRFHYIDLLNKANLARTLEEHKMIVASIQSGDLTGLKEILEIHHYYRLNDLYVNEFRDYFV